MAKRWLVKTEPGAYAYADLERDGRTAWNGVSNALAQIHLRAMRPGDEVFVYHTGREKAVVGVAKVVGAPYPDPDAADARLVAVDLVPAGALPHAVPLARLKAEASLADWELIRVPRLSVMPVPAGVWRTVRSLARRVR